MEHLESGERASYRFGGAIGSLVGRRWRGKWFDVRCGGRSLLIETGNDSWRFKSRDDDHAARARTVSTTPTSSDGASATGQNPAHNGSNLQAD
jgi:hypothetical protein